MKGFANSHLLVTPRELAGMLDGAGARPPLLLDLRPPDAYAAGHIPGAVHIDLWGVSLIDTDPAPLKAFMWMIEHVLAEHGVDASVPVVVYDEQSGIRAARAFWFLEYFGHPSVRMLDGGFTAWVAAGLAGHARSRTAAEERRGPARARGNTIATWKEVRGALGRGDVVLLDTRTDGEYAARRCGRRRGGAIPGAVHIEWTRNLTPDGRLQAGGGTESDVRGRRALRRIAK